MFSARWLGCFQDALRETVELKLINAISLIRGTSVVVVAVPDDSLGSHGNLSG